MRNVTDEVKQLAKKEGITIQTAIAKIEAQQGEEVKDGGVDRPSTRK